MTVVELVFMMLVLKLPIIYVGLVCWWAIRAEPEPREPALLPAVLDGPEGPTAWQRTLRPRRPGPHGGPVRGYARTSKVASSLR
jgi:hypothetical protein